MSAAEKLKALKETGFTCEHWTDFNVSDLDVTDELIAVVEAAENSVRNGQLVCDEEIELDSALAALDDALTADGKTPK